MGESSGGIQIQGTPQIIRQEVPGPLSTLEIWEYIGNHQSYDTRTPPPNKPPNGSIILYDKNVVDFFRQDGYEWKSEKHNPRKDKDIELQGYYARGIPNENFKRRLYWTKDTNDPNSNIVVVHYLEEQPSQRRRSTTTKATIKYGKGHVQDKKRKKVNEYDTGSSSWPSSNHVANYGIASRVHHHQLVDHHTPLLPATVGENATWHKIWDELERRKRDELGTEPDPGIPQSKDIGHSCSGTLNHQANTGSGITSVQDDQQFDQASFDDSGTTGVDYQQQNLYNEDTGPRSWINHQANTESSILSADHEQLSDSHFGDNHEEQDSMIQYADWSSLLGDTGALTEIIFPPMPESPAGSNVVVCIIEDFAPDWGYAYTSTKVLITGSFINNDQQHGESCQWYCVFGEDEVRAEYLSTSNLRCYTPLKKAGSVEFYVKISHGSVRSDVKSFEFRDRQNQEIDDGGSYRSIELSQIFQPLPTSITPRSIDTLHEQRMFEGDQVPDQALQAPTKYGKNKSRRWYKGVSNFLLKLGTTILKARCGGLS